MKSKHMSKNPLPTVCTTECKSVRMPDNPIHEANPSYYVLNAKTSLQKEVLLLYSLLTFTCTEV